MIGSPAIFLKKGNEAEKTRTSTWFVCDVVVGLSVSE